MYPQKKPYVKPEITVIAKDSPRYSELLKAAQQNENEEDSKKPRNPCEKEDRTSIRNRQRFFLR